MVFYLFAVSVGLCVFWLYYVAFLRRTTFFNLNRWYLTGSLLFSLLIPLCSYFSGTSNEVLSGDAGVLGFYKSEMYPAVEAVRGRIDTIEATAVSNFSWLPTCYFLICGLLLVRFIWSFVSTYKIMKASKEEAVYGLSIYQSSTINQPFCLFNKIFFPKSWGRDLSREMVLHEHEHAQKGHTIDLILLELAAIVLWFNPIIYLYKRSVRLNLEYLADRAVLHQGGDPLRYQSLLILNTLESSIKSPITTHFATPLKNRITMMKKKKTQNWMRITIFGVVPLAAGLVAMNTRDEVKTPLKESLKRVERIIENNVPAGLPMAQNDLIKISSGYGLKMHPFLKVEKLHAGIDLVAKTGVPVYATADGEVVVSEHADDNGNYVKIKHSDKYATQYAHLDKRTVSEGEKVEKGQVIGYVGSTGKSTGPHLHYEVHENGEAVNPQPFIK
ncbi:Peptidase, family M23 [Fulvivirga imtechensis AK7]|uniref:Peptidase, family M23 n=1 Tax=Fulvivirga imtechensis AK7 TaxID=1237149 RepID=L8JK90_9BACT|nr:peptidoglycan DD-metalloendopeptidase family protein [Fulvivirga imtechensis]ELR68663.1 Peptidase, family M23 [Fulvivirga imtechensis AK7]